MSCKLDSNIPSTFGNAFKKTLSRVRRALKKKKTPPPSPSKNTVLKKTQSHPTSLFKLETDKDVMFENFKNFFHTDLIGFLTTDNPKFRMVISGSFGVKTVLEHKHGVVGRIKTGDVDFTLSTYKSTMTAKECKKYWEHKLELFFKEYGADQFKIKLLNLRHSRVPIFKYNRDYVLSIEFKGQEFVDIAITNYPITKAMVDRKLSLELGLPLKQEEYYLHEFLGLIYMENVPSVEPYVYGKRNPISGLYPAKGTKDIMNSKMLCGHVKKKRYLKYCGMLENITIDKLRAMPKKQRDKYFKSLGDLYK